MAAPLPRLCGWLITRTVESPTAASTLSVPSDDPSSTTITSTSTGSSTARIRRITSATVERSLNTGTITDSREYSIGSAARRRPALSVLLRASAMRIGLLAPLPRSGRAHSLPSLPPLGTAVGRGRDRRRRRPASSARYGRGAEQPVAERRWSAPSPARPGPG